MSFAQIPTYDSSATSTGIFVSVLEDETISDYLDTSSSSSVKSDGSKMLFGIVFVTKTFRSLAKNVMALMPH